jgi:phosphoribosylglycinamide formyltransferase-1
MARKRVAILISGRGSNMAALIKAASDPSFPAEIALVVSDRAQAAGLALARDAGTKAEVVEHTHGSHREAFERAIQDIVLAERIDLVCLAGFMRLLTPSFVGQWSGRMLNIHPALLPAFRGLHTHERALAAGVKIHGATAHFVVPEMDAGPIVAQAAVPVLEDDTPETLARRVLVAEHRIYPLALRLLAEGRIRIVDGRCHIAGLGSGGHALFAPDVD